ncbi:MAG: mechanosensitive ion channel [Lachnospiraceae bacterium]|nr:mechanosensitive ion channel [Lachnospiraceae bacterium]
MTKVQIYQTQSAENRIYFFGSLIGSCVVGIPLGFLLCNKIAEIPGLSYISYRFPWPFLLLYFVLVLMIASSLGVDAASILAILGSASVAIGLAVQGSLSNFAGGVLLLILKPFTAGDYIKDGQGNEGTVDAVDIFYTQLITPDNRVVVLPNGTLANGTITNFTRCSERRIDIPVGISYDGDIKKAKAVIEDVLRADAAVIGERDVMVFVDSLGESSVNLVARCWSLQDDFWPAKWRLTEAVKYALDEAGIKIPYPQMDVHLDKSE